MENAERLDRVAWFAGLDPAVRAALIARGRWRRRAAGEWVYGEGDEDTGVIMVVEGALYLHAQAAGGREALIGLLPQGQVMGQSIVFGGGPRLVTAICAVDSLLFLLSDRALNQTAQEHPGLWPGLSALAYGQLRTMVRGVAEFVALSPRERMISRLMAFSAFANPVPISQAALAEMVGVGRNAVNGWLAELEVAGKIARGYGRIEVLDREGLQPREA